MVFTNFWWRLRYVFIAALIFRTARRKLSCLPRVLVAGFLAFAVSCWLSLFHLQYILGLGVFTAHKPPGFPIYASDVYTYTVWSFNADTGDVEWSAALPP